MAEHKRNLGNELFIQPILIPEFIKLVVLEE